MSDSQERKFFEDIYRIFSSPLSNIDCGEKCGAFNEYGVPVCCDVSLIVPSAYRAEWDYLKDVTDLWQPWRSSNPIDADLEDDVQDGQVLLKCLGYRQCQRQYRTMTCRAFPFFPYLDSKGNFLGLMYFQEYREYCWIISNLSVVTPTYKAEFQQAFNLLFNQYPESKESYAQFSSYLRKEKAISDDKIILLDFDDNVLLLDPDSEISYQVTYEELESFGPFSITKDLNFPDEDPI
ncbi:MAG: hypothetical protein DRJ13_17085 [Bacteroidetes bacterium]|nr:MAG: hypothetical protein DRJ13_17085 [Bacteroidota bacterium]